MLFSPLSFVFFAVVLLLRHLPLGWTWRKARRFDFRPCIGYSYPKS
jgi:hypothetical protein